MGNRKNVRTEVGGKKRYDTKGNGAKEEGI